MKKRYLSVLMLVVLALVFTGCATATPTEATEAPAAETEAPAAETEAPATGGLPEGCETDTKVCAVFAPGEPIKIGYSGPMTGGNSAFGIDSNQAVDIALKDAGEFEGHAFVQVYEDDEASPEVAASVAQKIAADPAVVGLVGHLFSGATKAAMPTYKEAMIVMVSPSATHPELVTLPDSEVFNRAVGNDFAQGKLAAEFSFNNLGTKKMAIIHDGGAYGQGVADRTQNVFKELGGDVVTFQAITAGETDYSAVLTQVAALSPDIIFYGGYTSEANVLVRQKAAAGLGEVLFLSDDGIYGTQFLELTGDPAEGTYCTSAGTPPKSEARDAFDQKFMEAYGVATGSQSPYSWYSYDSAMMIIEGIKKVAIVQDDKTVYIPRAALVEAVRATAGYKGLTGELACDDVGECSPGGFSVFKVEGGEWIELPADYKP